MKTKYLIGLLCAVALAGLFTITKAPAQGNRHRDPHQAVIIGEEASWHYEIYIDPVSGERRQVYVQDGLVVSWIDASEGAPRVALKSSLSVAIAYYMNEGYAYETIAGYPPRHTFRK